METNKLLPFFRNEYIVQKYCNFSPVDPPVFPRSLLPKAWGVSQLIVKDYIEFNGNDCLVIGMLFTNPILS